MTGREAAANRSREEKLEKECIRLAKEVSRLRDRDNRWTYSFSHVARSLTWRLVMRGNELLARVLRVKGAPPAWQLMQGILEERDDRAEELGHKSASASGGWMHAEGATSAAGLTVAAPGQTLLSAPQTPKPPKWLRVARLDSALEFPVGLCNVLTETPIMDSWKHCEAGTGLVLFTERAPNEEETETIRLSADSLGGALRIAALNAVDVGISLSEYASTPPDSLGDDPLDLTLHRWWHDLIQELRIALEPVPFSARAYLLDNPDVIEAIDHGDFESAEDHWETIGRAAFLNGYRTYNVRHDPPSLGLGEVTEDLRAEAAREIGAWEHAPTFSILMPVYKVPVEWLRAALDSVMAQLYESWTLCIVDDASDDAAITEFLKSLDDPRIEILTLEHNQGIAGATQAALEMASGDYIALLDHDDEITPDAFWLMARAIVNHAPDILYSDESTLTVDGRFLHVHFKPDYTREMILSQNYICHFGVYRREIALEAGGFRPNFEGSQDHDFLLRCLQQATSIFHVTRMLYYWRAVPGSTAARFENKNHAWAAGRRAVASAASAVSSACEVEFGKNPGTYRVIHPRPALPSVTIIIPFRDEPEMLNACLASLEETLPAEGLRILGVDNQSAEKETTNLMQEWSCKSSRVQFLTYDHPFNYAAINNFAARHANTKHLLLLNNDVTAIESGWLEEMVSLSELRDVGAVGAKLLYPDDTLQHAGVIMGIGGVAGHSHKGLPDNMPGYFCRPSIHQNVSAVTGACLMVKADLFRRIGGLKERDLGVAFNDVDFCLRLIEAGYRNVYTPHATLYHHESKSRGYEDTPEKRQRFYAERFYILRRHSIALSLGDPWYNPNLTLRTENFARREDTRP